MVANKSYPPLRKDLNGNALLETVRGCFAKIADPRTGLSSISLSDALMSAFAMFSLKDPSLLAFEERRKSMDSNLQSVFGLENVPSDTRMRELLDPIDPGLLRSAYKKILAHIQRGKMLENMTFLDGHYLLSGDGTGFFHSKKLSNGRTLEKISSKGEKSFQQMFYGAALVHPDRREVIPFPPEFIVKQDGATKNDCEREASKRFLAGFRREHPHLPIIMIEDGLASNAPHIKELKKHKVPFILGAKETDHEYLFEKAVEAEDAGTATNIYMDDPQNPKVRHNFFFVNDLPLNKSNKDLRVNLLEYWEIALDEHGNETTRKRGKGHFSWVTDISISGDNVYDIMRGGRARWKIENETFNTLKNQGYHLEHNYGLGKENLSLVFVALMMLAFLLDQTLMLCCGLYKAARAKSTSNGRFFEKVRSVFYLLEVETFNEVFEVLAKLRMARVPEPEY
jgi:hypothetical protein